MKIDQQLPEHFHVDLGAENFDVHAVLRRGIESVLQTRAQPQPDGSIVTLFPAIAMIAVMAVADTEEGERRTAATGMSYVGTPEPAFRLHLAQKMRAMADDIEAQVRADAAEIEPDRVRN